MGRFRKHSIEEKRKRSKVRKKTADALNRRHKNSDQGEKEMEVENAVATMATDREDEADAEKTKNAALLILAENIATPSFFTTTG